MNEGAINEKSVSSEVMVTIMDADRTLHETMPTGLADVVLAALTAEPETLAELECAVGRYDKPSLREGFLRHFSEGLSEELYDAGLVIIDLAARLVVADTEPVLYQPARKGYALSIPDPPPADWSTVPEDEIVWVRYALSGDWRLVHSLEAWRDLSEQRRSERAVNPPFDARPVLFGKPMLELRANAWRRGSQALKPRWLTFTRAG